MDVNPLILITAGAAVVGAAAMVICRKPQPEDKPVAAAPKRKSPAPVVSTPAAVVEPTPAAAAEVSAPAVKKGKKKVRSNKKKKSAASASEPDDDSEEEPVKPAAAASTASKPEVKASVAAPEPEDDDDDNFAMYTNKSGPVNNTVKKPKKAKETPEQKAARQERQRQREAEKVNADLILATSSNDNELSDLNNFNSPAVQYDGWNVVEVKKPKKKESDEPNSPAEGAAAAPAAPAAAVQAAAPEPQVPAAPVVETITTPMTVDSKKLGLLIGPKGVTKIGIQNLTGATIEMPKIEKDAPASSVTINVSGPAASVAKALHALNELVLKGYCTLLAGDDFQEGYVAIHPRFLPDVIGKGGACIRALQQHTGVKITTPANTAKPDGTPASKVKIGLAGPREKVTEARNLIKEITKYYHTSVTHPGVVHIEMDIPSNYYNYIIGSKGSEIKHIQNSFKVSVYIPNADSNNSNVLIVGEPANVATAEKHIHKLIEKVNAIAEQKAAAEAATLAFKAANAAARAAAQSAHPAATQSTFVGAGGKPSVARVEKDDEPQEEWMKEFAPRQGGVDFAAILPSNAKLAAAPAAAPVAAESASSAESS